MSDDMVCLTVRKIQTWRQDLTALMQNTCHALEPISNLEALRPKLCPQRGHVGFVCWMQWVPMLEPSAWWWDLRTRPTGGEALRDLLRQMLLALQTLQEANVTHR